MQSGNQQHRQTILAPYLEQLATLFDEPEASGPVTIGSQQIELAAWERDAIIEADPGEGDWRWLLAETAALRAKLNGDLGELGRAGGTEAALHDVQTDAAVGFALIGDLQHEVDALVVGGDMAGAKRLSGARNRLARAIADLKDVIGETALTRAEAVAHELRRTEDRTPDRPDAPEPPPEVVEQSQIDSLLALEEQLLRKHRQTEMTPAADKPLPEHLKLQEPRQNLARPLAAVLLALGVIWAILVAVPSMNRVEFRQFTREDFAHVPVVHQVMSRAPSLFIRVDGTEWDSLSADEREGVMRALADAAAHESYSGIHVTTLSGRAVAQWLERSGTRFLE